MTRVACDDLPSSTFCATKRTKPSQNLIRSQNASTLDLPNARVRVPKCSLGILGRLLLLGSVIREKRTEKTATKGTGDGEGVGLRVKKVFIHEKPS